MRTLIAARSARVAACAALLCAQWLLGTEPALAQSAATPDVTAPTLVRVVQDMHTAEINQIRADERFDRLVTSSSDKTLRVWRLSDLQLQRTISLPADVGREGTPYSIALSADGQRLYAAGYTGYDWRQASHVYQIDADTGRIVRLLGQYAGEVVTALDLSPDGRRLAVGLGRGGLSVIDAVDGTPLFSDPQYAGSVSFLHFATDGRLASTSADGCLRVYGVDGRALHRNAYPPIAADKPQCGVGAGGLGGVRFSPNGRWLALGQADRPEAYVLDAQSLALRRVVRIDDAQQRSLCCIAWSTDGSTLYVNGAVESDRPTPLYRIRDVANGKPERWEVGRQQFSNMLPMPDGSVVFATTAPSIARVDAEGRPLRANGEPMLVVPHNVDFHRTRNALPSFVVSPDGGVVAFEAAPGRWLRAAPLAPPGGSLAASASAPPGLIAARRSGAVSVQTATGLFAHRQPTRVNGQGVALGPQEDVRSWAVHATRPIAAFGTQWRVHLVDAAGKPMPGWENPPSLPAPAYHCVLSDDGRWVVVAVGDGTVRWYGVATGREALGLFVHDNAVDWVAWRPDGYYASSPAGDQYIGWLVSRGMREAPTLMRAVQFERQLYRPDLLRFALADTVAGSATRSLSGVLAELAAPKVSIDSIRPSKVAGMLDIRFTVEGTGRPIAEIGLYIDGIPVLRAQERAVNGSGGGRVTRTATVPAGTGPLKVRVEAETARSIGVDESVPAKVLAASAGERLGTLWVVAIGVAKFGRASEILPELPNTLNDARELANALAAQRGKAFSDVRVTRLGDLPGKAATKANILAALKGLEEMQAGDTAVVFLASHGAADASEYYLMTADAEPDDVNKVLQAQTANRQLNERAQPSLLTGTELTAALRRLPGRRILLIDTCRSGAAGSMDPFSLVKRSASAQLAVVSAATGAQESYELLDKPHGVFTFALLEALAGRQGAGGRTLTLREVFDATRLGVERELRRLKERVNDPKQRAAIRQDPVMVAPPVLERSVVAAR